MRRKEERGNYWPGKRGDTQVGKMRRQRGNSNVVRGMRQMSALAGGKVKRSGTSRR